MGAGLIFSGITDICGMLPILARMPWNRLGASSGACVLPDASRSLKETAS
jgi:hypothetical protein